MFQLDKCAFVLFFTFFITVTVVAQTPDASPTPTETERRLQAEIDQLKLEKTKAELERDIRNARPQPTATPLTGDVTGAKDLKMEINLQTYRALRQVTDRVACDIMTNIKDSKPGTLVLYKPEVYQALVNYRAMQKPFNKQLDSMAADYAALFLQNDIKKAGGVAPDGFAEFTFALRSLADLLALFRTNVDFNYGTVTVNENALRSLISNSLRRQDPCNNAGKFSAVFVNNALTIYDPDVFYPTSPDESKLMVKVEGLLSQKQKAARDILIFDTQTANSEAAKKIIEGEETTLVALKTKIQGKIEERLSLENQLKKTKAPAKRKELTDKIKLVSEELDKLGRNRLESTAKKDEATKKKQAADAKLGEYNKDAIVMLKQLNTEFSQFYTALNTRDAAGQTPLSNMVKTEALADILDKSPKSCYWVSVRSVDAGGTTRVRKNLFRNFYYPDIAINGGGIVEYTVSRPDGQIIISNVNNAVQEFRKPGNIFRQNENDNQ